MPDPEHDDEPKADLGFLWQGWRLFGAPEMSQGLHFWTFEHESGRKCVMPSVGSYLPESVVRQHLAEVFPDRPH